MDIPNPINLIMNKEHPNLYSSAFVGSCHFSKKPNFPPVKTGILIFAAPSLRPVPFLAWGCQNRHKIS